MVSSPVDYVSSEIIKQGSFAKEANEMNLVYNVI